jgi:hypothetical protein
VESLERFHQSRTVVEDFSAKTLAAIPSVYGRLYYVSSLRESGSGRYEHDGLTSLYPESAVQEGLTHCHEELFSRILETPLKEQEADLDKCLRSSGEKYRNVLESWRENHDIQNMCPDGLPGYLQDLFRSNMGALLAILSVNNSVNNPN